MPCKDFIHTNEELRLWTLWHSVAHWFPFPEWFKLYYGKTKKLATCRLVEIIQASHEVNC
jgi:hypothetical protein